MKVLPRTTGRSLAAGFGLSRLGGGSGALAAEIFPAIVIGSSLATGSACVCSVHVSGARPPY